MVGIDVGMICNRGCLTYYLEFGEAEGNKDFTKIRHLLNLHDWRKDFGMKIYLKM